MPGNVTASGRRLGFETLDRECQPERLETEGRFPEWLSGTLLRTGPAMFEAGGRAYNHWFDGLGMLHRFTLAGGAVTYGNRFVRSRAYRAATETGRMGYSEFATDPCRSLFRRVVTAFLPPQFGDNANVSITRFAGEFLALTESALPVVFDPRTLETLGVSVPAPGELTVAHPHRAPQSGELVSYATHFGAVTKYRVYARSEKSRQPRIMAELRTRRPAYMHSFAITERYAVLVEFPFVVLPLAIPLSGRPFIENYRWKPRRGTWFRVIELGTGKVQGSYQGEPFFAFHHVNAYENGNELVVDLCAYDDPDIIGALYLDRLRSDQPDIPAPRLRRYRVPLGGGDVGREDVGDASIELPRIDYGRRNGRPYQFAYGVGVHPSGDLPDRIVKIDVRDGHCAEWSGDGIYPGEPVFVPAPEASGEDDGVLLSVVLDPARKRSFLLALDAASLVEVARTNVPHHIPLGLHGEYFADLH